VVTLSTLFFGYDGRGTVTTLNLTKKNLLEENCPHSQQQELSNASFLNTLFFLHQGCQIFMVC
jgi:hypothetical protein